MIHIGKKAARRHRAPDVLAASAALASAAIAAAPSQAASQVTEMRYQGLAAHRISDGKTEAVVVPALNRVMRYGFVGGANWLWNNPDTNWKRGEWRNWGGDKTWLAPQSQWPLIGGRAWPPDEATDASPATAGVLPKGILRTATPISSHSGARVVREYSLAPDGDFVIRQTIEKVKGGPLYLSAWSVTQIAPPHAIFLPLNAQSPYKNNFLWLGAPFSEAVAHQSETLLQIAPNRKQSFKVGSDAPNSSIAAFKDGVLFLVRAQKPAGDYPDGALGAGLPVELWNNGDAKSFYNELELLSPLRLMHAGTRFTHTMKWRLQRLRSSSEITSQAREEIEAALRTPF